MALSEHPRGVLKEATVMPDYNDNKPEGYLLDTSDTLRGHRPTYTIRPKQQTKKNSVQTKGT